MDKRRISFFTVFFLVFSMLSPLFSMNVQAYQNSSYFSDLKVGLKSISKPTMSVVTSGIYSLNGSTIPSGTVLNIKITNGNVNINGAEYLNINLIPQLSTNVITLNNGSKTAKYLGSFSFKVLSGNIMPINSINMEDYLKGVVCFEMDDGFPLEALKAQAVAARNYALTRIGYEKANGYDFDDTPSYQVYGGYNPQFKNVTKAVDDTKGQILLYSDNLVETLYSASHGGYTENSLNVWGYASPYLISKPDPYENELWPNGDRIFTNAQIDSTLKSKGYLSSTDTFIKLDLNSITKYESGRVGNINIIYKDSTGITRTKSVQKDKCRTFLSLPSSLYNVFYNATTGVYTFSGKGNGHGLGMSQIGARNRANAGQAFDPILKFYYDGSYLQNLIQKASIQSFNIDKSNVSEGDSVLLSSSGQGGSGQGYLYKYVITYNNSVIFTRDYSTESTLSYKPANSGSYNVSLYVKDKLSTLDYDAQQNLGFTVYKTPQISSFTESKSQVISGQNISFNGQVIYGSSNYLYKYTILKDNVSVYTKDYSSDSSLNYTPVNTGSYSARLQVKDTISNKDFDADASLNFSVFAVPSITALTGDKSEMLNGDLISLTASAQNGSGQYLYKYAVEQNGTALYNGNFTESNSFTYVPASSGNYNVVVYVKDKASDSEYDAQQNLNFKVYNTPQVSSFTESKTDMISGQNISFNGQAIYGSSNYLYRYTLSKDDVPVYTNEYSSESSLNYTPVDTGVYTARLQVKDMLSNKDFDADASLNFNVYAVPSIAALNGDKTELLNSQSVSFTTSAQNGSGQYLYKYDVEQNGAAVYNGTFTENSTFSYIPSNCGSYDVSAYLKDKSSDKDYDAAQKISFTSYDAPHITSFSSNKTKSFAGTALSFNVSAAKGSGDYQYKFVVLNNGSNIFTKDYSSESSFNYTPAAAGDYQVTVYLKDRLTATEYSDSKTLSFSVYNLPKLSTVTASGYMYENRPLTITANSTGGSSDGVTYRIESYKVDKYYFLQDYSASNSFTFKPVSYGTYVVEVYVKDNLSTNSYDDVRTFSVNVLKTPMSVSALPISYGMRGTDVSTIQNGLNKLGFSVGTVDGIFGSKTSLAVSNYQKSKNFKATGTVDTATFNAMNNDLVDQSGIKTQSY